MRLNQVFSRQSSKYLSVFVFAFLLVVASYLFEQKVLKGILPDGIIIGLVQAISALLGAQGIRILRARQMDHEVSLALSYLGIGLLSFAFADICWAYLFYVAKVDRKSALAVFLTHIPYGIGYCMATSAQYKMLRFVRRGKGFASVILLSILITTPLYFKFIVYPGYWSAYEGGNSLFFAGHVFNTFACYLLGIVSLALVLSARDLFWSLLATGSLVLVLENWAFRAEMFFFSTPPYGFYDHLWAFGILTCCCPIWISAQSKLKIARTEPFDGRSLVTQSRRWVISICLVAFLLFAYFGTPNNQLIRMISLVCVVALLVAVFLGQFLSEKIEQFAMALSTRVTSQLGIKTNEMTMRSSLPLELRDVFETIFRQKLEEKKEVEKAQREVANLALRVAHDIRSPLLALQLVVEDFQGSKGSNKLVTKAAIGRIREIANELIRQGGTSDHKPDEVGRSKGQ